MKNKSKVLLLTSLLLIMSFMMSACSIILKPPMNEEGNAVETQSVQSEKASDDAESAETLAATSYPLTIKDSADREVTLPAEVKSIVSLGPNMTELVFALGAQDRLKGRTDYCDYPEEVKDIPSIGTLMKPDLEKIAEIKPDLVLASTHVSDETLAKLDELGLPTLMLYDSEHLDGLYDIILTLGHALNLNDKAAALEKSVRERIEAVKAAAPEQRPRVYYVVGFGESGDFTAGGKTFVNGIIEAAGGDNIAKDIEGWEYSSEKLIEEDPDVIIIPSWAAEGDGAFGKTAPYNELTAVKEGRVFAVDNNEIDRQGPRNADAVEKLAELFAKVAAPVH